MKLNRNKSFKILEKGNFDELIRAIENKRPINEIKNIIEQYNNLNYFVIIDNNLKGTPLSVALENDYFEIAIFLLENGANINFKTYMYDNVFEYLYKKELLNPRNLDFLFNHDDNLKFYIINYFIKSNSNNLLTYVLAKERKKIQFNDDLYKNAFHYYNLDSIPLLMEYDTRNSNIVFTNVFKLFNSENNSVIKELFIHQVINKKIIERLDEDFYINLFNTEEKRNIIQQMISSNNFIDLKCYIYDNSIILTSLNSDVSDILIYSIETGASLEIIEFIIRQYPTLNYSIDSKTNNIIDTPLLSALKKNNLKIANLLLKNGADINYKAYHECSFLRYKEKYDILYLYNRSVSFNNTSKTKTIEYTHRKKKIHKFLLNNGFEITSNLISELIKLDEDYSLSLILKYYIFDNTFIQRFLNLYQTNIALSNQQLDDLIAKEISKININQETYINALKSANYNALGALLDFNNTQEIINALNNCHFFQSGIIIPNYEKIQNVIDKGRIDILNILIANNLDIYNRDNGCNILLTLAVRSNNIEVIKYFLHCFRYPQTISLSDLSDIIRNNNFDIFKLLIPDNLELDDYGKEVLVKWTITSEHKLIINHLFQCGMFTTKIHDFYYNILENIMVKGDMNQLKIFVENQIEPNIIDKNGYTALEYAVKYRKFKMIEYLIRHGANPLFVSKQVIMDILKGELDILNFLIASRLNIHLKNDNEDEYSSAIYVIEFASFELNEQLCRLFKDFEIEYQYYEENRQIEVNDCIVNKTDYDLVHILVSNNINVDNFKDENGNTLLTYAIKGRNLDMVKYLIDFGASISFVNNNIISIHPVIYWNDLELLKYLISQKLDINRQDKNGHSPLIYAIKRRNISIIQCLIEHGADIQLVNNQIKIIDSIIDHERLDILKYLVTKNLDINSQDEEGQTPLIHAIKRRKLDVMKYLIDYKADIKAVNDKIKVIDSVIDYNKLDILDCLVNKNLNINSQDEVGHTPLIYAIHRGNFNIIKYLIEHGADIQIVNRKIETLKTIIDRGQLNILDYLINKKLDINSKDKEGHTLLAYAIKSRKIEVIKYLIDHGANLRNINQKVKLIKESVIFWNELEILKYLVKHHLNIHQKDENGNTLLHYAIEYKKSNIIDYLKKFENNSIDKQNNECHHQAKKTKI